MIGQEEFLKQLREAFAVESQEHVKTIAFGLLSLEQAGGNIDSELLETTYRAAHSLKGAARAVDLKDIEYICHSMESVFLSFKQNTAHPDEPILDVLHEALNLIERMLGQQTIPAAEIQSTCTKLDLSIQGKTEPSHTSATLQPTPTRATPETNSRALEKNEAVASTIRVRTARLEKLLREAENLLALKQLHLQLQAQIKQTIATLNEASAFSPHLQSALRQLSITSNRLASESVPISTQIDNLVQEARSILLLPCSSIFDSFPLTARDIAKSLGKEIRLDISGASIELEKQILEKLKDPLMHLLRNAIDHGIESPGKRERIGKTLQGHIRVAVSQVDAHNVEIEISDDGSGIDTEAIRHTALMKNIRTEEELKSMTSSELYDLLFESGFSTSDTVTDLSGRGLGLAIVKQAVSELEGTVGIVSEFGKGTSFSLIIPYSKASFKATIVRVGQQVFAIPTNTVVRCLRIPRSSIIQVGTVSVIEFNNEQISIARLSDLLGIQTREPDEHSHHIMALICRINDRISGFAIDELLGERDVLMKPLGNLLQKIHGLYGAIIGDHDEVIPMLDMKEILGMAYVTEKKTENMPLRTLEKNEEKAPKHILVVEDSITSRTLITSILSAAGYSVNAAVDGIDGFTLLKSEHFDLVVSDVEMPRLDGFGLTEKIRGDSAISNLPVILVTTLSSRENREKGIAAGANAYINKSDFAQSNLLETVRRFL